MSWCFIHFNCSSCKGDPEKLLSGEGGVRAVCTRHRSSWRSPCSRRGRKDFLEEIPWELLRGTEAEALSATQWGLGFILEAAGNLTQVHILERLLWSQYRNWPWIGMKKGGRTHLRGCYGNPKEPGRASGVEKRRDGGGVWGEARKRDKADTWLAGWWLHVLGLGRNMAAGTGVGEMARLV